MLDEDYTDEFLARIADKYTAEELVEVLGLDVWQIIEMFRERVLELDKEKVKYE